ncbi:hypothetical protein SRHO_G00242610 [Serrasalmus rhombeus]
MSTHCRGEEFQWTELIQRSLQVAACDASCVTASLNKLLCGGRNMAESDTSNVGEDSNSEGNLDTFNPVGMGRGFFSKPISPMMPGQSVNLGTPGLSSTRYVERARPVQSDQSPDLSALITQLAEKLGESITAQLRSDSGRSEGSRLGVDVKQNSEVTLSNVRLVMQSDAKEPPIFRGDSSDKYTVQEWENLMMQYLRKRAIPVQEHSQEILAKLMGKAGDVVRIKLRNTSADHLCNPPVIFHILKQHFSDLNYSNMPLADFYNTLPNSDEDAMDYWIRLNKTVDVAEECLKRQGRRIHDLSHEVSMMFLKHCPDESLSRVFKFKAAEKWLASEIQERLDEYMQEKKALKVSQSRRHGHWKKDCPLKGGVVSNSQQLKVVNAHLEWNDAGVVQETLHHSGDAEALFEQCRATMPSGHKLIYQSSQRVHTFSELFYCPVLVNCLVSLKGMLDSGSMACTINKTAEEKLREGGALSTEMRSASNIVLVGCGGAQAQPEGLYDLELQLYNTTCLVPTLVVPGQRDELILGSNVIKHLLHVMKNSDNYWDMACKQTDRCSEGVQQFLSMFMGVDRWSGTDMPDKIGTAKLPRAVTLKPRSEHLVWGRLPAHGPMSPGSTVIVEPTSSRAIPRNVLVGRVISPMWGDRWVPMTIVNPSDHLITLKRNCKLADVSPCLAAEDLDLFQSNQTIQGAPHSSPSLCSSSMNSAGPRNLSDIGLGDIDIDSSQLSESCNRELVDLLYEYQDIFSKHPLDCGEAKGYTHRIRLTDDRPFRLPYRRVPPAHYQKLRQVLSEMEERGIIRKSTSDYASPLVMVWKKDGGLRICTDFRWLNARTLKDAHPLPHQSDCLAALGGNCLFSSMDLTSGFYNIPVHENDKKYTAFTTPMGLLEYNRLPQGLSNSPASFMRMMLSIFGDLNFSKLLCYLDDLLVFAPSESEALGRLRVVFQRMRENNLKLAPKKCHLMQKQVRFLGHIVDSGGVSMDPAKVDAITKLTIHDLFDDDGSTPSVRRIKSFLGMVFYYQHFIPSCSAIAKPLFALTGGQKRRGKTIKIQKHPGTFRKLSPEDWTDDCTRAFQELKKTLLECVVLAHPDFARPFILSVDASLDGLGAVLSQVPEGETKARPVAFASKTLNAAQSKYPAHRLEFLALKWSVCEKFSHWLKGHEFTVWTDNNPLTFLLTKPKLDACELRWVSKLASYSFDLKYLPGRNNVVADALSRDPFARVISQRLLGEPYHALVDEACAVHVDRVQKVFQISSQPQVLHGCYPMQYLQFAEDLDSAEIHALCEVHSDWTYATECRAIALTQSV